MSRVVPTATSTVVSGHWADRGIGPPSVATIRKAKPCRWMGWWLIWLRLPMRMRTRSPSWQTSGYVAGMTLPFMVRMLKSVISNGSGRNVPPSTNDSCSRMAKSRSGVGSAGLRGCTTNMPTMPSPSWLMLSKCEWYMNVPAVGTMKSYLKVSPGLISG